MNEPAASAIRAAILGSFPPARIGDPLVQEMAQHLAAVVGADSLGQRLHSWIALIDWARSGSNADSAWLERQGAMVGGRYARWRLLFDYLAGAPQVRSGLQQAVADIIAETEGENLFGDAGLPGERGFLAEMSDRMVDKVLPQPLDEHDLSRLLGRLFRTSEQAERFAQLPPEIFDRMVQLLAPPDQPGMWGAVRAAFSDGFRLLATRVRAQGLAGKLRTRSRRTPVAQSPFYRLTDSSESVLAAWGSERMAQAAAQWRADRDNCYECMADIWQRLEREGVSIDVVYGLKVLDRALGRMELMLQAMEAQPGPQRSAAIHTLLSQLVTATLEDRSVRHLVTTNFQLLQRKIVERAGQTGEHYIAWTRKGYWHILAAAAGGGALTVLTAANKMAIYGLQLPLFVGGLLAGLNYAVSFLLLQWFGLILATKQPAMTAAALGTIMRIHHGTDRLDTMVAYAAQIVRSQLAAALSNVVVVALGAYLFSFLWQLVFGVAFLDVHEAEHVFETTSPLNSLTIWYAALTGVILWLAAMIGGWFDNWAAYHRLPQAIAEYRLGERFGRSRMVRLAGVVSRNTAGWGTNVSLGLMLGLVPAIGMFSGLPLDVRHVTLNTGIVSLATAGMGQNWFGGGFFVLAVLGIGTMFVLNLGVSFTLSLYTAARAFGLPRGFLWEFARTLGRRFVRSPGSFLLPPGRADREPEGDLR
jgi:site-specific recombinase